MSRPLGQHILPRLFINGFAARVRKKQVYTYLFRANADMGKLCNTRDVAKRRLFYGEQADTGLEGALARAETGYARIVAEIRTNRTLLPNRADALIELIANLSVRTHHLRSGMTDEVERVIAVAEDSFTGPNTAEFINRQFQDQPELVKREIRKAIRQIPHLPREPLLHIELDQAADRAVREYLKGDQLSAEIRPMFAAIKHFLDWDSVAHDAHVKALGTRLKSTPRIESLRSLSWTVVTTEPYDLILGDFGPVGQPNGESCLRPLSVAGSDLSCVLLPLSHDLLVVGSSAANEPTIDIAELNLASAAMSSQFFVASRDSKRERELAALIGTRSNLLTDEEFRNIKSTVFAPNRADPTPDDSPKCSISFEVVTEGTPTCHDKATNELQQFVAISELLAEELEVRIATHICFLITDDLPHSFASIARDYGYDATFDDRNRATPAWSMILSAREHPPLHSTVLIHADLWDNDDGDLVLCRWQLFFAQLMQVVFIGRRITNGAERALPETPTFMQELEALAEEMLDVHDANRAASILLPHAVSATDDSGNPIQIGDVLIGAYSVSVRELLERLGHVALHEVQRYRLSSEGLEALLPSIRVVIRDLLQNLAHAIGISDDSAIDVFRNALESTSGFSAYLEEDWAAIVSAFREQPLEEARVSLATIAIRIIARIGLYVDDLDNGDRDLIVGTPRLISTP